MDTGLDPDLVLVGTLAGVSPGPSGVTTVAVGAATPPGGGVEVDDEPRHPTATRQTIRAHPRSGLMATMPLFWIYHPFDCGQDPTGLCRGTSRAIDRYFLLGAFSIGGESDTGKWLRRWPV